MVGERLGIGLRNAKTAQELADELGIDKRAVLAAVEAERRNGVPICASKSGCCGFFLPETIEEFDLYVAAVKRRVINESITMNALQEVKRSGRLFSSIDEVLKRRFKDDRYI